MRRFAFALAFVSSATVWLACAGSTAAEGDDAGTDSAVAMDSTTANDASSGDGATNKDSASDALGLDVDLGPSVALRFGNCGAFTACGGDPTGSFKVTDICVDTDMVLAEAKQQCPTISGSNWNGTGAGGLAVSGNTWASLTQTKVNVDMVVPPSCTQGLPCSLLGAALKQRGFDSATCKDNATSGCDCSVSTSFDETSNGAFTNSGTRVTASNNSSYDYCRNGSIVTLNPQKDSGGPAPIFYTYSL